MQNTQPHTLFRYPDKPALSLQYGQPIPAGKYLCQYKPDGERCIITYKKGQPVKIVSRHNKPLVDAEQAKARFEHIVNAAPSPFDTIESIILDAEHVCNRRGAKRNEAWPRLCLLDCLEINGRPQFDKPAHTRWYLLNTLGLAQSWGVATQQGSVHNFIERAKQQAEANPQMAIEGVVLKQINSPFIGSTTKSALNPGWLKVKW